MAELISILPAMPSLGRRRQRRGEEWRGNLGICITSQERRREKRGIEGQRKYGERKGEERW
jgi:hypothetical protein